jgi:hypothetical protein
VDVRYLHDGEETSPGIRELYKNCVHSVFQTVEFNRIVEEVFSTRLRFVIAEKDGEIMGVCPIHVVRENWLRSSLHASPRMYEVPYGGWVLRDRALEVRLARMLPIGLTQEVLYWSLPVVGPDGWQAAPSATRFETLMIDLTRTNEDIFRHSVDGKRRNMIRKAGRSNVEIVEGGTEDIETFYEGLLKPTNSTAGIPVHPKSYYAKVLQHYGSTQLLKFFLAKHQGVFQAAVLVVCNKWFAHYWIGAKAEGTENLGQGELLQWHAIQWAKAQGCLYYDLCGYEPERLPQIAEFKADFSRTVVPFYLLVKRRIGYRIAYRLTR